MYPRAVNLTSLQGLSAFKAVQLNALSLCVTIRAHSTLQPPHHLSRSRAKLSTTWKARQTRYVSIGNRLFGTTITPRSWWTESAPRSSSRTPATMATDTNTFEFKPMTFPDESPAEAEQLLTRRVHILGIGSIGTLIAHSLRCLPNSPPITLLMHREDIYRRFIRNSRTIRLINKQTEVNDEQRGFDVDVLEVNQETDLPYWRHVPDEHQYQAKHPVRPEEKTESGEVYIYTLIVTAKGPASVESLASVKHRVNSQTTICLMQNGMGQIEELNRLIFTDPKTRPTYMLGVISHGAHMQGPFAVIHAGFGSISLGIWRDPQKFPLPPQTSAPTVEELSEDDRKRMYPSEEDLYANLSSRYLLRTLTRSPVLACAPFPYLDLFQLQLEKLAINAILNPLTALLNFHNGRLYRSSQLIAVQRLLLAEISLVLRSLPELEGVPGLKMRFSAARLETLVRHVADKTALNSSSMREDVRRMKRTEIEYINGYIVRRGEELGIKCVLNYMLTQLVEAKSFLSRSENELVAPSGASLIHERAFAYDEGPVTLKDQ